MGATEPLPRRGIIDFTPVGAVAVVSLAPLRPSAPGLIDCRHRNIVFLVVGFGDYLRRSAVERQFQKKRYS